MSRALVVSGGGSKGAYAVGVAEVLMEEAKLRFDVVSGTSTGGLIAPFVATNRLDAARFLYTTVQTKNILKYRSTSKIFKAASLASFSPLIKQIREAVANIGVRNLQEAETQMFLAATRLQDRNAVFFHNGRAPAITDMAFQRITDEDTLVRAMVATASIPGIAPPVDICGFQYVDGGLREMTPLSLPVAMGMQEIYIILLSPRVSPLVTTRYNSLGTILGRTADSLTTDVSRHDLDPIKWSAELLQLFEGATHTLAKATKLTPAQARDIMEAANPRLGMLARTRFVVIGPAEPLTDNVMQFNPTVMKRMMMQGVADARAVLDRGGA